MNTALPTSRARSGYLVAVSAPNSDIEEMKDGSWHVIADLSPNEKGMAQGAAQRMIPFILGTGGDLVMYRMDDDPTVILRQGGKTSAPPIVEDIVPYDEVLSRKLEVRRTAYVTASRKPVAPTRTNALAGKAVMACYAAGVVAAACIGVYAVVPAAAVVKPSVFDPDQDKADAIRRGAIQVTMVDPKDSDFMLTVRFYPGADGKEIRQVVDRFRTSHYTQSNGYVPKPQTPWLRYW